MKNESDLNMQSELLAELSSNQSCPLLKGAKREFDDVKCEITYLISLINLVRDAENEVFGSDQILNEAEVSFSDIPHARLIIEIGIFNPIKTLILDNHSATTELFESKGLKHIYVPIKIKQPNKRPTFWQLLPIPLHHSKTDIAGIYGAGRLTPSEFSVLKDKTLSETNEDFCVLDDEPTNLEPPKLPDITNSQTQTYSTNPVNFEKPSASSSSEQTEQNGWEKEYLDSQLNLIPPLTPWTQVIISVFLVVAPLSLMTLDNSFWSITGALWLFVYYPLDYLGLRLVTPFFTAYWFGWGKAPWWMPLSAKVRNIFIEKQLLDENRVKLKLVEFKKNCPQCESDRPLEVEHEPFFGLKRFSASCREKRGYHSENFKPF